MATPPTITGSSIGSVAAIPLVQGLFPNAVQPFLSIGVGTFTANGASTVTVADANITANSIVIPTLTTVGGTVGAIPAVKTITAGTGFTIAGTASDSSVYAYLRIG